MRETKLSKTDLRERRICNRNWDVQLSVSWVTSIQEKPSFWINLDAQTYKPVRPVVLLSKLVLPTSQNLHLRNINRDARAESTLNCKFLDIKSLIHQGMSLSPILDLEVPISVIWPYWL